MSATKRMLFDRDAERREELLEWIDEHDCHLTGEDGCECTKWREELEAGPHQGEV